MDEAVYENINEKAQREASGEEGKKAIYSVRENYKACEDCEIDLIEGELVVVQEKSGAGQEQDQIYSYKIAKSNTTAGIFCFFLFFNLNV